MITTDYTEDSTFQTGYGQQSRILKYFRDVLLNWFADSRNIKDLRLISLLYDSQGNLKLRCVKIGTPFDPDEKYTGATPAILVSLGDVQYQVTQFNQSGNGAFQYNKMLAPLAYSKLKTMNVGISVITLNYDGTLLLTLLILMFITMNTLAFKLDCKLLKEFNLMSISAPKLIKSGNGNAKQLYLSTINIVTQSFVSWSMDTQGPVFKGIKVSTNFK